MISLIAASTLSTLISVAVTNDHQVVKYTKPVTTLQIQVAIREADGHYGPVSCKTYPAYIECKWVTSTTVKRLQVLTK